jgi:hypothetical protein
MAVISVNEPEDHTQRFAPCPWLRHPDFQIAYERMPYND